MPAYDYIPGPDEAFRTWAEGFSGGINLDTARYMLTPPQGASIQAVVDDFVDKLAIASNEATRTRPTVAAKDDSRSACESLCRQYALLIKDNAGISDDDKIAIGVRPVNPSRTPIDCPQNSPLLNILGATPGSQTLRFADPGSDNAGLILPAAKYEVSRALASETAARPALTAAA